MWNFFTAIPRKFYNKYLRPDIEINNGEDNIFWDVYTALEVEKVEKQNMTLSAYLSKLFYMVDSEYTTSRDRRFYMFFLSQSSKMCMALLTLNIIFLVSITVVISQPVMDMVTKQPIGNHFQGIIVQVNVWVLFSLIIIGYFLIFNYKLQYFERYFETNCCDVWISIGNCVLATRLLILVAKLTRYNMALSSICYATVEANDNTIMYAFLQILIDTVQTFTFSVLPFPWPWSIYFGIIEFLHQILRLKNCSYRVTSNEHYNWIVPGAYFSLSFIFIGLMLSSLTFERSASESFTNNKIQKRGTDDKKKLVDLLCSDVKVPLQYVLAVINSMEEPKIFTNDKVKRAVENITKSASAINVLSDDLLLMIRLTERRFSFNPKHKEQDLEALFRSTLNASFAGVQSAPTSEDANMFDQISTDMAEESFFTDRTCLYLVVRYMTLLTKAVILHCRDNNKPLSNVRLVSIVNDPADRSFSIQQSAKRLWRKYLTTRSSRSVTRDVLKICVSSSEQLTDSKGRFSDHLNVSIMICNMLSAHTGGAFRVTPWSFEIFLPVGCIDPALLHADSIAALQRAVEEKRFQENEHARRTAKPDDQQPQPEQQPNTDVKSEVDADNEIQNSDHSLESSDEEALAVESIDQFDMDRQALPNLHNRFASNKHKYTIKSDDKSGASSSHLIFDNTVKSKPKRSRVRKHADPTPSKPSDILRKYDQINRQYEAVNSYKYSACIFIDDTIVANTVAKLLYRTGHFHADMGLLRVDAVERKDLSTYFLVVANSYDLCVTIREVNRFRGYVVLFSGDIGYLDLPNQTVLSYALPMPLMDRDKRSFTYWLEQKIDKSKASVLKRMINTAKHNIAKKATGATTVAQHFHNLNHSIETSSVIREFVLQSNTYLNQLHQRILSVMRSNRYSYVVYLLIGTCISSIRDIIVLLVQFIDFFFWKSDFGIKILPPRAQEGYTKWRLINPTTIWLHHMNLMQVKNMCIAMRLIFIFTEFYQEGLVLGTATVIGLVISITFLSAIGPLYRHVIGPNNWSLAWFWKGFTLFVMAFSIIATLNLFFRTPMTQYLNGTRVSSGRETSSSNEQPHDLYSTAYGSYSSSALLYAAMNGTNLFVSYFLYLTWPYVNIVWAANGMRLIYIAVEVGRKVFTVDLHYKIILISTTLLVLVVMIVQCFYESMYRKEFIELRENILAQKFIDRCQQICLQDMYAPLESLVAQKRQLVFGIQDVCVDIKILATPSLLARLQPLHLSELLARELLDEIKYNQMENMSDVAKVNDVILLKDFVFEIVNVFALSTSNLEIQVLYEIDKKLEVIRCNKLLLQTLIINTFTLALRNVKRDVAENPRKKFLINEILVKITPLKASHPERFVDTRLMLINVIDSSTRPKRGSKSYYSVAEDRREGAHDNGTGAPVRRNSMFRAEDTASMDGASVREHTQHAGNAFNIGSTHGSVHHASDNRSVRTGGSSGSGSGSNESDETNVVVEEAPTQCFGQNICHKMVHLACPPERAIYETGHIDHEQYGTYQRFTIPYKLTTDSNKAYEYVRDRKDGFRVVQRNMPYLYKEYNNIFELNSVLGTSVRTLNDLNNSTQYTWLQSTKLKLCKLNRGAVFYCSDYPERIDEFQSLGQIFEGMGWKCRTVFVYPDCEIPDFDEEQEDASLILIDSRLQENQDSVSIRDVIIQLRVFGYTNSIAILFDTVASSEKYLREHKGEVTEVHLGPVRPITSDTVAAIAVHCDIRIISQLLQTKDYAYECVALDPARKRGNAAQQQNEMALPEGDLDAEDLGEEQPETESDGETDDKAHKADKVVKDEESVSELRMSESDDDNLLNI